MYFTLTYIDRQGRGYASYSGIVTILSFLYTLEGVPMFTNTRKPKVDGREIQVDAGIILKENVFPYRLL